MDRSVFKIRRASRPVEIDAEAVLNALSAAVIVVDENLCILRLNNAAEQFLRGSALVLLGQRLDEMVPADSPMFALIDQARAGGHPLAENHVTLTSPRIGHHLVNIHATPLAEVPGAVAVSILERSIAAKIDRQITHRGAARSVSAMGAMLAHEVKNPLAGIRGAAQLLEQNVADADRSLTALIRDEADRVCALVDRFVERYDPSLPAVHGDRDQLVQVFLNLLKNAAEAAPHDGGEIIVSTAYRHGVRFAVPGTDSRIHLPLMVSIQDNGPGIPEDIRAHLFDPFVTAKPSGSGLDLALVAKIIGDHGGVIEFDSQPKRTEFRVMLPMVTEAE